MKIPPVYTMPFSFHSGLGFLFTRYRFALHCNGFTVFGDGSTAHSAQPPNGFEASRIDNEVPY